MHELSYDFWNIMGFAVRLETRHPVTTAFMLTSRTTDAKVLILNSRFLDDFYKTVYAMLSDRGLSCLFDYCL